MFVKTSVIKNFEIFRGKLVSESLYFNLIPKEISDTCENRKIFTNSFFYETNLVAAFASLIK